MTTLLELREIRHNSLLEVKVSFCGSGNSGFNVKDLVPELHDDKTPRAQTKFSYKLVEVKVSSGAS